MSEKPQRRSVFRRIAAFLVGTFCVLPFAYLLTLSFSGRWIFPDLLPEQLSTDVWRRLLASHNELLDSAWLSVAISLAVAFISTVAGYVTGRAIAYHPRGQRLLLMAYVPFIMSPVILGVCLMYAYIRLGLTGTAVGVVLAQLIFAFGFSIVFFSGFWSGRVKALEDVVYTLGGSQWLAFVRVLLPVSKGMVLICFFQTFLISWFQYGLTLLIGSGQIQTLPIKVYDYVNEANFYLAAVASCLLVLPPAALIWINKRILYKPI